MLEDKLEKLQNATDFECWYLVKQPTDFGKLCYLVSILCDYQQKESGKNIQDYVTEQVSKINSERGLDISTNYRALRVAAFFGLIVMTSTKYNDAIISETYYEIQERCAGHFENTATYSDIIQRQIEKMFISSSVDEECDGVRSNFRLYPVMLLYKILIELGRTTGDYFVSTTEYRYIVATTEKFSDFLSTLLLITLLRKEDRVVRQKFEEYRTKFDNRLILALKQLQTLNVTDDGITLRSEYVDEVAKKVFFFEQNPDFFNNANYANFLGSKSALISDAILNPIKKQETVVSGKTIDAKRNLIYFGAPGTGKSHQLQKDSEPFGKNVERVTFFPNYSYAQFVGSYKPVMRFNDIKHEEEITYSYVPGPFIRQWMNAQTTKEPVLLIIEELNRANAPAVFGDMFQLLDRKNGISEYPVATSEDLRKYLKSRIAPEDATDEEIKENGYLPRDVNINEIAIPDNMFIWTTMNSADQGVFPLDTAFKRRWDYKYFSVFDKKESGTDNIDSQEIVLHGKTYKWGVIREKINDFLAKKNVNEDKLIGPYFISDSVFSEKEKFIDAFCNKIIMYLFEDAARQYRKDTFQLNDSKISLVYSQICKQFRESDFSIFKFDIPAEPSEDSEKTFEGNKE